MKRLKKGIFPLIIGIHILLRIVFSDAFTNDEIVLTTTNIVPNVQVVEKQDQIHDFVDEKGDLAILERH